MEEGGAAMMRCVGVLCVVQLFTCEDADWVVWSMDMAGNHKIFLLFVQISCVFARSFL